MNTINLIQSCRNYIIKKFNITLDEYFNCLRYTGLKPIDLSEMSLDTVEIKNNRELYTYIKNSDEVIKENKREKTGSYYTPKLISSFIIKLSLSNYFDYNISLNIKELFDVEPIIVSSKKKKVIINELLSLKVVDLASGSGSFLLEYIEIVEKLISDLTGDELTDSMKLKIFKTVYANDLQKEPLELFVVALMSQLKSLETFSCNLEIGDALYKKSICECSSFDIVLGNPPYIGEKNNRMLFQKIKNSPFGQQYYEGKMDYFYFFIYKGCSLLKPKGIMTYITTNYFIAADGAKKLRSFMKNNLSILNMINFNNTKLFAQAMGQHNLIFSCINDVNDHEVVLANVFSKKSFKKKSNEFLLKKSMDEKTYNQYTLPNNDQLFSNDKIHIYTSSQAIGILDKIKINSSLMLKNICQVNQGIVSGADRVSQSMLNKKIPSKHQLKYNISKGDPIFVLSEYDSIDLPSGLLKPMYKSRHINRYSHDTNTTDQIIYITDDYKEELPENLHNHLFKYYDVLANRREVKKGSRKWYALQWPRRKEMFINEKIVVPQRSKINKFAYSNAPFYASADIYYITMKEHDSAVLKYLVAVLNSKLNYFWLSNCGKKKGDNLELYSTPLKNIPICLPEKAIIDSVVNLVDVLLSDFSFEVFNQIERIIATSLKLTTQEYNYIERFYKEKIDG